jgi:hypothetical protein
MKVVQTTVSPEEHALLVARARRAQRSLKDLLRSIIRSYLDDPFFSLKFKGKRSERGSAEHDVALYGTGE